MIYEYVKEIPIEPYAITEVGVGRSRKKYKWICAGYDIETTSQYSKDEKGNVEWCCSFPYIQQFSINNNVVLFHTYDELMCLLDRISRELGLNSTTHTIIFIHNLSYEFAHMMYYLDNNDYGIKVTNVFAKKECKPLKVELSNGIIFIDSYSITNMSLEKLAKNYCDTQKMVGDLDYTKQRHYETELTQEEKDYCINDVLILSEYSKYYFEQYLSGELYERFTPLTSTSIVRHELKEVFKKEEKKKQYKDAILRAYPRNLVEYNALMQLFTGGYTHANVYYVDYELENVDSFDLKSSYPAVMLNSYMPVSPFYNFNKFEISDLQDCLDKYCCWFRIHLHNVKNTTTHSVISASKCIHYSNDAVLDNGRILSASDIVIDCTELDYDILTKFYTFEVKAIPFMRIAARGMLPNYLRKMVAKYYQLKHEIGEKVKQCTDPVEKKELKKEYARVKAILNSFYGMCVTKVPDSLITFKDGEWSTELIEDMNFKLQKEKGRAVLLPQWGVWITSHARWRILDTIHRLSIVTDSAGVKLNACVYCDTDSTKILHYNKVRWIYDQINASIILKNREFIDELELPYEIFYNIGTFEHETAGDVYQEFKTMGSKRYIYKDSTGWHSTIAGLPKSSLINYCEIEKKNPMDVFSNNMKMNEYYSEKLTTYYVKEPREITIDDGNTTHTYVVPSCVCLVPTTFKMSVTSMLLSIAHNIRNNKEFVET